MKKIKTKKTTAPVRSESASLAFNDLAKGGTSDKVYFLNLTKSGDGYTVTAQYGRRGSALATDNKTKNGPVDYDTAKQIFDRVTREKINKGYVRTGAKAPVGQVEPPLKVGASFLSDGPSPREQRERMEQNVAAWNALAFEPRPQELLEEIPHEDAVAHFITSDRYWMQDKSDGHSRGAVKDHDGFIFGLNKTGGRVPLPAEIVEELSQLEMRTFQIDAEIVGNKLVCRDLLNGNGYITSLAYSTRFAQLVFELAGPYAGPFKFLSVVETWEGAQNKAAALARSRAEHREGVVFKLKDAPHRGGRNGQHKKFKFVKTCSVIAGEPRATGKDSVEIYLLEADRKPGVPEHMQHFPTRVGTVSLIGKPPVKRGNILEVAYLYAFPSKMLCQARLLRIREDVLNTECTTAQLIFKRSEAA